MGRTAQPQGQIKNFRCPLISGHTWFWNGTTSAWQLEGATRSGHRYGLRKRVTNLAPKTNPPALAPKSAVCKGVLAEVWPWPRHREHPIAHEASPPNALRELSTVSGRPHTCC